MATVTHYLITNRQIDIVNGEEVIHRSGNERAVDDARISFRFARYTFDPDNVDEEGEVILVPDLQVGTFVGNFAGTTIPLPDSEAPERLRGSNGHVKSPDKLSGSNQVFAEVFLNLKPADAGDVLFFIHGYKSDLTVTLQNIRLLHNKYVKPDGSTIKTIVTFTWPARKSLLRYLDDQYDAQISGYAMARVYQRLHDFLNELFLTTHDKPCGRRIHLMCHSMGNQVLYYMLESLIKAGLSRLETFGEAVLVGADVPYDAFERDQPLNRLIDLCEQVHVYYHRKDLALVASSVTKFRQNRLGRVGFKTDTIPPLPADVHEIDTTHVPSEDTDSFVKDLLQLDQDELIQHWTYLSNQAVVDDISLVFRTGRSDFSNVNPPYPLIV